MVTEAKKSLVINVPEGTSIFLEVPLEEISPNPYQPQSRVDVAEETAEKFGESILAHGLLQIPVCRKVGEQYQMGDGWLRLSGYDWLWRNGHPEFSLLPIMVKEFSDRQMADLVMEANTIRQDLTPIELAGLYQKYIRDFKITQAELARQHNVSQGEIANTIRLLDLPDAIQQKIISQEITETHGRTLLQLNDKPKEQLKMAERIVKDNISVAQADGEIKNTMWNNSQPLYRDDYRESPLFDLKVCDSCDHKAMLTKPWGDKDKKLPRCTDAKCWKGKQEAAFKFSRAAEVEKLANQGITKIFDEMDWQKHSDLVDEGCNTCDKRGAAMRHDQKLHIICLDRKCAQKKQHSGYEEDIKRQDEKRAKQYAEENELINGIIFDDSMPADRLLEVSIECLLRAEQGDTDGIMQALKLCGEGSHDGLTAMPAIQGKDTAEKTRILARLVFELFTDASYDEGMDKYMLKRFKGEAEFAEDTDEEEDGEDEPVIASGAKQSQETEDDDDEVEDSEEDDDE
jgi:ParB family chromosome partitioning protein